MIRAGKRYRRPVSIEFMGHFSTYKHIQTSCHMGFLRWFIYIFMSPMNTLTMHYTVFLLVLLFLGFSLRPSCGSEQRTDRPMVIKRNRNSSLLLSDSAVTCPSSDSSLVWLIALQRPAPLQAGMSMMRVSLSLSCQSSHS